MLFAAWIAFFFVLLFLLGSAVGSFLNVCIVRLPQGRSLIRPPSCCGQCGKAIRWQDNIPLVSYWVLRGRCRACGASFSMRYFWIEFLTGLLFVVIFHLEVGRNIHRFQVWSWYDNDYELVLMRIFDPQRWLVFSTHAVLGCLLIVATMCIWEQGRVPNRVTTVGLFLGLLAALFFPWPWPDMPSQAVIAPWEKEITWRGNVTPRQGLYPWPVWDPLPQGLAAGSRRLGLATGLAGIIAGAVSMALIRLLCNAGTGTHLLGWGETSLLAMAGGFLGWQPIVVAVLAALVPGLTMVTWEWTRGRRQVSFALWLSAAVVGVWFGWYWIGPLVQGLFFNPRRLLWLAVFYTATLLVFTIGWSLATVARRRPLD